MRSAASSPAPAAPVHFFILVFALSLPFWILGAERGGELAPGLPVSALQAFCPLAAVLVLLSRHGRSAVSAFLRRPLVPARETSAIWYLAALVLPPVIALLSWVVLLALGRDLPFADLGVLSTASIFLLFFLAAVAEELGWSAYAFSSLQGRTAALRAAVIVGVVWAVWHWYPLVQAGRPPAWILWWSLGTIASRVLLGWLYNSTGQRVLAPALFHATQNVCWQSFPRQGSHYDPQVTGLLLTGVAIAVVAAWGPRRLSR